MRLCNDDQTLELDASDAAVDSLAMLADAGCKLVNGQSAKVDWFLEPEEVSWRFEHRSDSVLLHVGANGGSTPFASGSPVAFAEVIWRALRRLQSESFWQCEGASEVWSYKFPTASVEYLGRRLKG